MAARLRRLTQLLAPDRFGRSVAILAGGTAFGQVIVLAAAPVLTRLYTVDEIGLFGLFTAFVLVMSLLVTGNYEFAIVSASNDRDASYLAAIAILLTPLLSLVGTVILVLLRAKSWLGYGAFPTTGIVLAAVALIASGLFAPTRYWLLRAGRFSDLSRIVVPQQAGRAGGQIAFGVAGLGFSGLALGDVFGRLIAAGQAIARTSSTIVRNLKPLRREELIRVAWEHRRFPFLSLPSTLLDTIGSLIPLPLVAQHYGLDAAGYYTLVLRVLSLPSALVGQSVADAFHTGSQPSRWMSPRQSSHSSSAPSSGFSR